MSLSKPGNCHLPPVAAGLRLTPEPAWMVFSSQEVTSGLGSCNLSVLSFICVQGICFYLLVLHPWSVLPGGEGKGFSSAQLRQREVWVVKQFPAKADVFQASLSLSALVKTAVSFELISFEVMM